MTLADQVEDKICFRRQLPRKEIDLFHDNVGVHNRTSGSPLLVMLWLPPFLQTKLKLIRRTKRLGVLPDGIDFLFILDKDPGTSTDTRNEIEANRSYDNDASVGSGTDIIYEENTDDIVKESTFFTVSKTRKDLAGSSMGNRLNDWVNETELEREVKWRIYRDEKEMHRLFQTIFVSGKQQSKRGW